MRLSVKLPLLILPLTAISLILVGAICYVKLRENAEEKTFKHAMALEAQVASYIDNSIATARANISLFADYPTVKYYLLTEDESERYALMQRPLQKTFLHIQKAYPDYYELRLLLPDGFEDIRIVNRDIANLTEEEGATALFQELQSVSDIYQCFGYNPDNSELACYLFKKISLINDYNNDFSEEPKLRGYLGITMNTSTLATMLETNLLGTSGGLYLTDSEYQPLLIPSHLQWLIDNQNKLEFADGHLSEHSFQLQRLAEDNYFRSSHEIFTGLWLHTLIPEQELLNASRSTGKLVFGVTIVVLLLSMTLMHQLLKTQVFKPLQQLRKAFSRIGEGEELVQVEVRRHDELGDLGTELNRMSLELKASSDQVRSMAFCDSLTQLPNRFMFNKNLKRTMECAFLEKAKLALFFIDLDNFKHINDTLGHQAGDKLLQLVADRLAHNFRNSDCVSRINTEKELHHLSRLGGDEFTLLLTDLESQAVARQVAERIIATISQPIFLCGQEHYVGSSIGIAIYPGDGDNAEDLIKHADLAMYQAKKQNKGSYYFFSHEISSHIEERTRVEQRLRKALEQNAFELHYQPILDCQNMKTVALEALLRWNDSELGQVSPEIFIPIAEDSGLICEIGDWVICEASQQLKMWQDLGLTDIAVTVNVSGLQLEKAGFFTQLRSTLQQSGILPDTFYIELTESSILQGQQEALKVLAELREMGVRVALDDFGTGYSSLSYLRNLPIDILKIDRSFIHGIGDQNNGVLLSAIITMAQALNLKVIAEGIEDQAQFVFLKNSGCDMLQGYLFCRPKSAAENMEILLKEMRSKVVGILDT